MSTIRPGLLGYDDDAGLLGYEDDAPLEGWAAVSLPGEIDPVGGALGGPVAERVYTISGTFYADWDTQDSDGEAGAYAIASLPIAGLSWDFGGDAPTAPPYELRVSSRSFATLVDDPDLPSVYWDGRVNDPGSISRSLPLVPVGTSAVEASIGSAVIDNTDGAFDTVLDANTAVSQPIEIKGGRLGEWLETFATLFVGRVVGIGMTETDLTIDLQDSAVYAQNLYPTTVWTGTGGAGGDAELDGVVKPVVIGKVWNMSPVLMDANDLIFAVNDGATTAISGVFDGGVALSFDDNYSNYTTLQAASVAPGEYATALGSGLIKLGSSPVYAITAHVEGNSAAGSTVKAIATYLAEQMETAVGLVIDLDTFEDLPEWDAGWVWNDTFSFSDALSRFVGDGGYYWGADTNGMVRAIKLDPPGTDPVVSYNVADILELRRETLPAGFEGVHHRRIVQYRKNWTVQSDSELASAAVERAGRQREWKQATATVSTASRNAIDPEVLETSLADAADAAELATHLLDLHGHPRRMFSLEAHIMGGLPPLGSTVRVTYPRFGLAGGDYFRVVAVDLRLATSTIHLLLWG